MGQKSKKKKSSARKGRQNTPPKATVINPIAIIEPGEVVNKDNSNEVDLRGMKQWIETLTFDSLLNALEFSFVVDGEKQKQRAGMENEQPHQRLPYQQRCDLFCGGNSGSHEFDLLMEMTKSLQRQNNRLGDDGGCDETEYCYKWRRSMKSRLESPTLFRWAADCSKADKIVTNEPSKMTQAKTSPPANDDPLASFTMGSASMPSELLDVLAAAGVKRSTSSLLETFNEADEIDQAVESSEDSEVNMEGKNSSSQSTTFTVEACAAGNETTLGLGTTTDQENADELMLLWTALIWDRALGSSNQDESSDKSTAPLPRCTLNIPSNQQSKKSVLRTLHVASRGKFLTESKKTPHCYLASWFDPTSQWFSLPTYLASRFEASLWEAYSLRRSVDEQPNDELTMSSLLHSLKNLDCDAVGRVLSYAAGMGVRCELSRNRLLIKSQSAAVSIRNGLLWKLLLWSESRNQLPQTHCISGELAIPLAECNAPLSELKSLMMDHLQEGLAHEAERALMQSIPAEETERPKSIKKKKKRAKKHGRSNTNQPDSVKPEDGAHSDTDQTSDDDEIHVEDILHLTPGRNQSQSSVQSHQLWASRSRRQTLEGGSQRNVTYLKRSKSSGDGLMAGVRSPGQTGKVRATTPRGGSVSDAHLWPSSDSPLFPQASQNATSIFDGAPLCLSGALDGWNSVACQKQNEASVFTDLLENEVNANSRYEKERLASSTVASIASDVEDAGLDIDDDSFLDSNKLVHFKDVKRSAPIEQHQQQACQSSMLGTARDETLPEGEGDSTLPDNSNTPPSSELSPPPSAPPTPPPQLSPILVSLADLGKLREEVVSDILKEKDEVLPPNEHPMNTIANPKPPTVSTLPRTLTPSRSRDDLRSIDEYQRPSRRDRDDHHAMSHRLSHRNVDALLSYRNVVAQSVPRKPPSLKSYDGKQKLRDDAHPIIPRSTRSIKTTRSGYRPGPEFPSLSSSVVSMPSYKEPILNKVLHLDVGCARSEGGFDGVDDASHCNVIPRAQTDDTMTKDGQTTISSVRFHPPETEELATLKEERNSYRDMCLTLGAENAKLRNLLAAKTCAPLYQPVSFSHEAASQYFYHNDQQSWPTHNAYPNQFSTQSIVAMSDAGAHRMDHESMAMSEDGTDMHPSVVAIGESQNSIHTSFGRRTSGGGTYAESDTSLEHNAGQDSHAFSGIHRVHQQDSFFGPIPLHGIESRLSTDITRYMQAMNSQLRKNEPRRLWAIKQLESTVKALWPRAQIKMYGSHVTKLCLPSSDVDFVISLPAVQNNAPATAPGDLEGRNAINETNQKVLARKLKSESWLGK